MAKHKDRSRSITTTMLFAYTDESGNTGLNLFDPNQPYFWTGTLLTNSDVDSTGLDQHKTWLSMLGTKELHGNELGIGKLNNIAASLKSFLETHRSRFVFTKIEKRYHAAARFAFTILDSDFNKAVSPIYDLTSVFHRKMSRDIFSFLSYGETKAFWSAYETRDLSIIIRILNNLRLRIFERHPDARGRELLLDAVNYACANAKSIFRSRRSDKDSPNVLALDLLLEGIHEITSDSSKVVLFRHDEQKQFGKSMAESFDLAKNVRGFTEPATLIFRMEKVERFACPIQLVPSHGSIGLQIIDLVIYLMSQYLLGTYRPRADDCGALTEYIINKSIIRQFARDQLDNLINEDYRKLMSREITPEALERVRQTRDLFEVRRIQRMESSDRSE